MSIVKVRLDGYRKIKPFWVDSYDANDSIRKITKFYTQFFTPYESTRIPIIRTVQTCSWKIDGYEHKKHYTKPKIKLSKPRRRYYRKLYTKNFIVNTKTNEWAEKGIYTVPKLKTICNAQSLKDPSGINKMPKDTFEKIYLKYILGTYFTNSVNYLKVTDNCKVNFYYASNFNNPEPVTPTDFIEIVYDHYLDGLKSDEIFKMCRRIMMNSIFGSVIKYLSRPDSYFMDDMFNGFGCVKVVHSDIHKQLESSMMIPLSTTNTDSLMTILRNEVKNNSLTIKDSTFDITFIPGHELDILLQNLSDDN